MNEVLQRWNAIEPGAAELEVLPCCGSRGWARDLAARRPIKDGAELTRVSDAVWWSLSPADWSEAFASHPRIGERVAAETTARSLAWSTVEQSSLGAGGPEIARQLRAANAAYEAMFGRIFLVCASGKTAQELLAILQIRMRNDAGSELREAAEQQRQITLLRLHRWLEAR